MPMKPCSSSYVKASKHQRDEPNCVNGWQLSIHWHMSVGDKGDALVIGENARISSICAAARSSTICMSWLVPKHFRLSFKLSLDYLTDALEEGMYLIGCTYNFCFPVRTVLPKRT